MNNLKEIPQDGLAGLKQSWKSDLLSGFMVSLLALPLSLGIAKASDFPPIMGLVTAIIGGTLVSIIAGSRLTIKGPAAGLIVIVAGAVAGFGGGEAGWHMALGAIVVAAVIQVLFGVFKLGKLSDFFPLSAIHGMLAAIGLTIMSKQLHIIMGVSPVYREGAHVGKPLVEPLELFKELPHTFMTMLNNPASQKIVLIGIISLIIVFGWPMIKNKFLKRIPAPMVVLLITIPLGILFGLSDVKGGLVKVGNIFDVVGWNVSFDGVYQTGTFIKYVVMFALVGSVESLLTVKAIDILDPYRRKSDYNKDLVAVGSGNILSGLLGGLPMISEVARSSANVNNGARTRWANFFHGISLLLFVVAAVPVIELIPNAALAAMLIGVGYRLSSPKEFHHTYKIGKEQLIIFCATIVATLASDLLIGIATGIVVKWVIHLVNGMPLRNMFKSKSEVTDEMGERHVLKISEAAIFSNYLGIKRKLDKLPRKHKILIDLSETTIVDHTVMENLYHFKEDYNHEGGNCMIMGLDRHRAMSAHPHAAMRRVRELERNVQMPERVSNRK